MRYILDETEAGWRVLDLSVQRVAMFGGLRLEALTEDDAGIMLGLVEAVDRANGVVTGPAPAPALEPAPVSTRKPALAPAPDHFQDDVTARLKTLADLARDLLGESRPEPVQTT